MSHGLQLAPASLAESIQRYLLRALYLMVITGFLTLASTGALDLPTLVIVGAAILYRGYLLAIGQRFLLSQASITYLTLVFALFFLFDFLILSGNFVTATVHFVLLLTLVRLFSARRNRDYVFLAVLAFLMILAAAVLTVDSTFLFLFAVFMLAAILTFILLEMRRAWESASIHGREPSAAVKRRMTRSLFITSPLLMLLILLGASAVFFILPRLSGGYLSAYARSGELSSGFSNHVELGRIGRIQQSNAVAMHIQIFGDRKGIYDLKWRGVALNNFDGRIWSNTLERRPAQRLNGDTFVLAKSMSALNRFDTEMLLPSSGSIHYRVLLEPIGTNVFFLAPEPKTLQGNYARVAIDRAGAVYNFDAEHPTSRYAAESELPAARLELLRASSGAFSPEIQRTYLQLPWHLDPRIPALAHRVTSQAGNEYDRVSSIEHFLSTNYAYSLRLGSRTPSDPIAYFLFERKEGHCEYFASAMAVLLRSIGIPSRVVNGFRTGEFNDVTAQYIIRARNAHSWVEAYFPGYGWVSFDPTPGAPLATHSGWSRALLYFDALQSFWREWIINYDFTHQRTLGREANLTGRRVVEGTREWGRRNYASLLVFARLLRARIVRAPQVWSIGAVLGFLLLLIIMRIGRIIEFVRSRGIASHPERAPQTAAAIWYGRMTRLVARRGWRKSPSQTPFEFVTMIKDPTLGASVRKFSERYERARFANSPEDAQQLPELFEEISANKN
jgi:transglutaminase-like putative cysteine protease